MGLFDTVTCEAPLPDGLNPIGIMFQTKSFPFPCMLDYRISRGGRLLDRDGNDIQAHGYICFYADIPVGAGRRRSWREYRARFEKGRLVDIERVKRRPLDQYYGLASFKWFRLVPRPLNVRRALRRSKRDKAEI